MNCRRVEKLIPLYVEGDLESHSSERIASHLEWCGRCNWLADEYIQSQSWLRSSEAHEFDEAFLPSFKRDVLKSVSHTRPSPLASMLGSLLGPWKQRWNRRQVFALGALLVIICGVLVLYLYQTRAHQGPDVNELAGKTQSDDQNNPSRADSPAGTQKAPGAGSSRHHRSRVHTVVSRSTVEPPFLSGVNKSPGRE